VRNALAQDSSSASRVQQRGHLRAHRINFRQQRIARCRIDVFVGKVDECFNVREHFDQALA
jgi:hypothetical protein